jgi:hypothetical protein
MIIGELLTLTAGTTNVTNEKTVYTRHRKILQNAKALAFIFPTEHILCHLI